MTPDIEPKRPTTFKEFKSGSAQIAATVYLCFAFAVSMYVIFGHNDGGVWFYMLLFYFPFSLLDVLGQVLFQLILPHSLLKWLWVFDLVFFVVGGTFWYYMLVKRIAYFMAGRKRMV
jgi:hypothetical protein